MQSINGMRTNDAFVKKQAAVVVFVSAVVVINKGAYSVDKKLERSVDQKKIWFKLIPSFDVLKWAFDHLWKYGRFRKINKKWWIKRIDMINTDEKPNRRSASFLSHGLPNFLGASVL